MPHRSLADPTPEDEALDRRIVAALETAPEPVIPAGFAARVAALSTRETSRRPSLIRRRIPTYGLQAAWASLAVLAIAIFALSPRALVPAAPAPLLLVECFLLIQFLALSLWLASRRFPGAS